MMENLVPVFPLGITVPVAERPVDEAADRAAIQALWVIYETAVLESDAQMWISLWDPEGLRLQPNGSVRDYDRLLHEEIDWVENPTDAFSILPKEIVIMGDHAYAMGTYVVDFAVSQGKTHRVDGKFISILRRQEDGSWRIFRSMTNAHDG